MVFLVITPNYTPVYLFRKPCDSTLTAVCVQRVEQRPLQQSVPAAAHSCAGGAEEAQW